MIMNEHVGVTLDVLPGTLGGITAALGGFNELVGATSMLTSAIAKSTSAVDAMMLTLGVGLVGLGYESAKAFGEVERSMKIVQSVSGQTATEIGVLTQAANDLSVRYKMGIDEITDGLTTLGRAGLSSVNTQLDTMKAGLEAAKVTGLQLDDVLNKIVQTTALLGGDINSSSFGSQSQELTSKILATSQTAPIDMNDVVQTLSYSGGTAAAGGINIQNEDALYDYLGTIAAFGQKGVSGSMAGTALRAFFTKPASQTSQVNDALGRLGMKPEDLWEDGGNKIRPVSEQIDLIQKQMDKLKMSQIDQIELWGKIVSPKMGQQMLKLNADSIRDLTEKIKQTDTAEQLAQNTMRNFMSDLSTLEQQGQREWREYGQAAITWIGPAVKGISGLMNILGKDIGGFPIFQQVVKGTIILVISKVIQSLGSVWRLMKGIGTEIKSQLQGFSQVRRTEEQIEADLIREYETMGLTEKQAKTFVAETNKMHSGFSASNKVLGELLAKLNEAVALMTRLSNLSKINSMKMIGNMTGSQYQNFYDENKTLPKGAWYKGAYNRGDLTKTDFAKLSLRHGIDQNTLKNIYYGTDKIHGQSFYNYALKNQTGFADSIQKGKPTFITATTLEKYLQDNQKGMYDPKNNPVLGIVEQIKADTGKIATTSGTSSESVTTAPSKTVAPAQTTTTQKMAEEQTSIGLIKQENQFRHQLVMLQERENAIKTLETELSEANAQLEMAENYLKKNEDKKENEKYQYMVARAEGLRQVVTQTEQQIAVNQEIINLSNTEEGLKAQQSKVQRLQTQFDEAILTQKRAIMNGDGVVAQITAQKLDTIREQLAFEETILFGLQRIASESELTATFQAGIGFADQLILAELEEKRLAIQEQVAALRAEVGRYGSQLGYESQINTLNSEIRGLLAEDAAIQQEINNLDKQIAQAKQRELGSQDKKANENTLSYVYGKGRRGRGGRFFETRIYDKEFGPQPKDTSVNGLYNGQRGIIYPNMDTNSTKSHFNFIRNNVSSIKNSISGVTNPLKSGLSRIFNPITSHLPSGNTGFFGAASSTMSASMMGMRNYDANKGFWNNWFWNAGMMQMVNKEAISETTVNMGKLGKVTGVASGALGSLGMMFGPLEIGMLALSMTMQGLQVAYQNYQKELEEINSALSEAREKIKEAEESFLSAYEEANPKATQDEKDEALLDAYSGETTDKDDGLQTYRDKLFGAVAAIEVNTRKKADKELHQVWGESGDWERYIGADMKAAGGWMSIVPILGQLGARDARYSGDTFQDWRENLKTRNQDANILGTQSDFEEDWRFSDTDYWFSNQLNSAESLAGDIEKSFDISIEKLDGTLNHYPAWIDQMEDKSDNAKYARTIMAEGIDSMGPTKDRAHEGIWGSGSSADLAQFYKMQSEAMQLSRRDKTVIMNAINDESDFFKKMQKLYFKDSKDGKLVGRDKDTEEKILKAIQNRLGGISRAQARIALTLAAVSEIQKVVSEQVQPTLMSHMEAAWQGVSISGTTEEKVGGTWGTTAAVQQGVAVISAQMARLLQQKAMELGSMQAEMAGIDMKDIDELRLAYLKNPNVQSITTASGNTYDAQHIKNAATIFSAMQTSPYEAVASQAGQTPDEAKKWAEDKKKELDKNQADALAVWTTQAKGLDYNLRPIITQAYLDSMKDSDAKATGAADSGKDKSKDKDSSKDTANKKNWVNLAICNKKEIPKLNVNLFKKPPNFTILNRNFKLRDVNVNTADDAKSIQNAVKNSIIEIQNRSNPKIIQDDAAEYNPLAATEGNTLPTGTKKTE